MAAMGLYREGPIATTVAPEADVYEVIATIDELNGLEGRAPAPGEELFVPATR